MSNKEISTKQAMRYARHIMLNGFDIDRQETLINSKVLIIGLGGLGCAAAQYLAASGIGEITLVDDDYVEMTNLQRQILHKENSLGQKKVSSAQSSLQEINSEISIHVYDKRLVEEELKEVISRHDLVLDCTDNLETRNLLNKLSYFCAKPLVSGAAIRMEGQVFCVVPTQSSACYRCVSQFFGEQALTCVDSGVLSPLVGIVGAMQALEAIKILCNYGTVAINTLQLYDAMESTWQRFDVNKASNCEICN